jgi:hypothetical protein
MLTERSVEDSETTASGMSVKEVWLSVIGTTPLGPRVRGEGNSIAARRHHANWDVKTNSSRLWR